MKLNFRLKEKAITLRNRGLSLRQIHQKLSVPKSTLSGWLKDVHLTNGQKLNLNKRWKKGLSKARKAAVKANRQAKVNRVKKIESEVQKYLDSITLKQDNLELFLAGLYLGDGFKTAGRTALGSSNPDILKAFVVLLKQLYHIDKSKMRGAIYARSDQKDSNLVSYWSKTLDIPENQFHKTQYDKRTKNAKTYENYKGVCTVYYFDVKIMRRLMILSNMLLGRIAQLVRAPA